MEIVFNKKKNNNIIPLRQTRCNTSLKRIVRKKIIRDRHYLSEAANDVPSSNRCRCNQR